MDCNDEPDCRCFHCDKVREQLLVAPVLEWLDIISDDDLLVLFEIYERTVGGGDGPRKADKLDLVIALGVRMRAELQSRGRNQLAVAEGS